MSAAVLSAGALGDLYGMRRMYLVGLSGAIAFSVVAAAAPIPAVLIVARAGLGVTLAFLVGLSLALTNAVFPPGRRAAAIAAYFRRGLRRRHPDARDQRRAGPRDQLARMLSRSCRSSPQWRLAITWRYVPETVRATCRLDLLGMALFAVALLG